MTTQNNAPSNLDLSACTVSADGGQTSTPLANVAKTVNDTNATVGDVNATVSQTNKDVADLKANYNQDNLFLKKNAWKAMETARLDNNGRLSFGEQYGGVCMTLAGHTYLDNGGFMADSNCKQIEYYAVVQGSQNLQATDLITWVDPKYNLPSLSFKWFGAIHPDSDGAVDLGSSDHAWNNCYLKNAPQVTSDIHEKSDIVKASEDDDSTKKLLNAVYGLTASTFRLNSAVEKKGADKARIHSGYIAQEVEQALRDNALDPSDFALWTTSAKTVNRDVDTGQKDSLGNPAVLKAVETVKDEQGNPVMRQKLRYDEIFALMLEAHKQQIETLKTQVVALSQELAMLKAKA